MKRLRHEHKLGFFRRVTVAAHKYPGKKYLRTICYLAVGEVIGECCFLG